MNTMALYNMIVNGIEVVTGGEVNGLQEIDFND